MEVLDKKKKYILFVGGTGEPEDTTMVRNFFMEQGFKDVRVVNSENLTQAQFFEVR